MKKKSKSLKVLIIIFALGLIISLSKFISIRYKGMKEEEAFENLRQTVETSKEEPRPVEVEIEKEPEEEAGPDFTKYKVLQETNPDFVAWLTIDGTVIDYPVMYTPEEPRYYMRRGFDKEYSLSGSPFIGQNGTIDTDMFIIYAHNMSNGTMFSKLDSYKDPDFYKDHKLITFTSVDEERTYEVFASLRVKVPVEDDLAYYEYSGDLSDEDYQDLVAYLERKSLIKTDSAPKEREQILILSTCSYHTRDGRFIIAAKRIK